MRRCGTRRGTDRRRPRLSLQSSSSSALRRTCPQRTVARAAQAIDLVRQIITRGSLIILCDSLPNAFSFFPLERITMLRIPAVPGQEGIGRVAG